MHESIQRLLALIPTTLAICSYNLEEVENCGNHVLVSGETHLEIIKDGVLF